MSMSGTNGSSCISFLPAELSTRFPRVARAFSDNLLFAEEISSACTAPLSDMGLVFSSFVERLCRVARDVSLASSSVSFVFRDSMRKGRMWDGSTGKLVLTRQEIEKRRCANCRSPMRVCACIS